MAEVLANEVLVLALSKLTPKLNKCLKDMTVLIKSTNFLYKNV